MNTWNVDNVIKIRDNKMNGIKFWNLTTSELKEYDIPKSVIYRIVTDRDMLTFSTENVSILDFATPSNREYLFTNAMELIQDSIANQYW